MKQVVQHMQSGQTSVMDVPAPVAKPGTVLVRTAVSLVSAGTERSLVGFAERSLIGKAQARPDLVRQTLEKVRREGLLSTVEAVRSRLEQPFPLGYASAGTVAAIGEGVHGFSVGDRVACAGGGYAVHAEYAQVPQNLLAHVPDGVDLESAAFATLGAIALHAFRLGEGQLGERVAVIGLGLLGQLAVGVARSSGCTVFGVDLDRSRVELARKMGTHAVERDDAVDAATAVSEGRGFDLVLICADTPSDDPVALAGEIARDRGRIVAVGAVGLNIPRRAYFQKELHFQVSRSYGPGRYDPGYEEAGRDYPIGYVRWTEGRNLQAFVNLLAEGRIDVRPLISHRIPVEEAEAAYAIVAGRKDEPHLGVLLTYEPADTPPQSRLELPARALMPGKPRLGVLGAGNFAANVLFPILRGLKAVDLVGLASASGLSAGAAGRRFGFRYATTDPVKLLKDDSIDLIAVLTRHHLHAGQVAAALEAGKHVFCEKPLALTQEELDTVVEAYQAADRQLLVGFNRRFAPLLMKMRSFLAQVDAPRLMHYRVNAGPLPADHWLRDPTQGGGRLLGEVCHFIDSLTFLAGAMPVRVRAEGLRGSAGAAEDDLIVTLEFADGSLGTIHYAASGDRAFPKERIEVFGGGRVAVLDDFRRLETTAGGRRWVTRAWLRQDKGHRGIWQAFLGALERGDPAPIPFAELTAVTTATLAAAESLRSGRRGEMPVPSLGK